MYSAFRNKLEDDWSFATTAEFFGYTDDKLTGFF